MKYSFQTGGFYNPQISPVVPSDVVELSRAEYMVLLDGLAKGLTIAKNEDGRPVLQAAPAIGKQELITRYTTAIQGLLDSTARERGYDSLANAVTYAEEPVVPKFQAEGRAFRAWRSACWAYCYAQLEAINAGQREIPTVEQLISELPSLEIADA